MFKSIRKIRKMTAVLWAWCGLIAVWVVAGANSAMHGAGCAHYHQACQAGTGIGVMVILFFGFCGFVFLSLIWFMTRPKDGKVQEAA